MSAGEGQGEGMQVTSGTRLPNSGEGRGEGTLRCLVFATVSVMAPAVALAQPAPTWRLDYRVANGVDGCPSASAVAEAVSRRLGRDPFTVDATNTVHIVVESARRGRFTVEPADAPPSPPRALRM